MVIQEIKTEVQLKKVAIITARGGSKRIPRKNIKLFNGKPIIEYSIKAALDSGLFDEVMVSTDDAEIAEISEKLGAKIPFIRSSKNSDDYSTTADVIMEVVNEYKEREISFEYICCIYPTAPFITAELLNDSYNELIDKDAEGLLPVVSFGFPIQRSLKLDDKNRCSAVYPEHTLTRSQDLEKRYHDAGQFYWLRSKDFLEQKKLYVDDLVGFELPETRVQDIDTPEDWAIAELKFEQLMKKS